ncbi:MAG: hypothetical protein HYV08_15445 [Deltaproteobacteria bacterium]|nr:hypothetical protein [Deltaproteobacteria bacterium]MBI3079613.1 hypothetical protein [Deltaproteobacteria bacterium]
MRVDGISSAYSALVAHERKLDASARNVANANTRDYKAQEVVIEGDETGHVRARERVNRESGAPDPDTGRESSNVDHGHEAVEQIRAKAGYRANLRSIETQAEVRKRAIDLLA